MAIGLTLASSLLAPTGVIAASDVASSATALQDQVSQQIRDYPGGVQTEVNKVSYDRGGAVVVFPLPGETRIPSSAELSDTTSAAVGVPAGAFDVHGCPEGFSVKWYCFYADADADYRGRSLQFRDCNSSGYTNLFSAYGFQNQTTSWVNTRNGGTIQVFQGSSTLLWSEHANQSRANVGAADNDQADRSVCFG